MEAKLPTKLTKGSRYNITLGLGGGAVQAVEGEFVGYMQYGSDVALMMRMEGETLRIVPSRSVLYMDILDSKEEEERPKENGVYFG